MNSNELKKLGDTCTRIGLNVPDEYAWHWDERFNTATVVFDCDEKDLILFPITQEFDHQWDIANIGDVPEPFCRYFKEVFGIIPGQKTFTSQTGDGTVLFAVWWPWGNGRKISLRVGLFDPVTAKNRKRDGPAHLRQWFNIKD
jgi:hypothetical protein